MKNFNLILLLGSTLIYGFGCNPMGGEKFKVEFKNPNAFRDLKTDVANVSVINNQLVLSGSKMAGVKTVTLKNNSQEEVLQVESASENQIIANGTKAISIVAGGVFDLILADAYGSASFQVAFTIQDGTITASKLSSMGATAGQVLKYNGSTWVPSSIINAQFYLGAWDAGTNNPDLSTPSSNPGDYFIVSTPGTFQGVNYASGDWIISDGYNWQKVANSQASVSSFNGRRGIVTLVPGDYVSLKDTGTGKITGSSLNDLANIDLSTVAPIAGNILKYDGAKWIAGTDNSGVTAASIVDADVSGTANIAQSKISGLATSLSAKQDTSSLAADVRAIPLTGLSSATGAVTAADTILGAFGKLMNTQDDYVSKSTGATIVTGTIAVSGTGMITIPTATGTTLTEAANVDYVKTYVGSNGQWTKGTGGNAADIYFNTGNVGIGTASPGTPLDVLGAATVGVAEATTPQLIVKGGAIGADLIQLQRTTGATLTYGWALTGNKMSFTNVTAGKTTLQTSYGLILGGANEVNVGPDYGLTSTSNGDSGLLKGSDSGTGAADKVGGDLYIASGRGTGAGASSKLFLQTPVVTASGVNRQALATRMTIDGSGNVGIGTTSPTTTLDVSGTTNAALASKISLTSKTDGASSLAAYYTNTAVTADAGYSRSAMTGDATANPATASDRDTTAIRGITRSQIGGSVNVGPMYGVLATAQHRGSAAAQSATGIYAYPYVSGGGTVTNAYSLYSLPWMADGAITNWYGVFLGNKNLGTGTISNLYGIYVQEPTMTNYFAGKVGIGNANPSETLTVNSTITATTGYPKGVSFNTTANPSAGNTTNYYSAYVQIASAGANLSSNNYINGMFNDAIHNVSGTVGGATGLYNRVQNNTTGTINNARALEVSILNNSTGTIGTATGVAVGSPANASGTLTNTYGIRIENQTVGTQTNHPFGLYQSGANDWNYFAGYVGIGITNPGYKLDVQGGDINASGSVRAAGVALTSDRRWKRNISPLKNSIEKIKRLSGVSYEWAISDYPEKYFSNKKQLGVIAQDVQTVFPELVSEDSEGYLSVNYPALIAPLIEAFKSQQKEIEANLVMFRTMKGEIHEIKLMADENRRAIASSRADIIKLQLENEKLKKDNQSLRKDYDDVKARLARIEKLLVNRE